MGSVIARKRGDRTYAYYVYYDNDGRRIEEYCGAKTDPESKRKQLRIEMDETEMHIAGLNAKLAKLKAQIDETGSSPTRGPTRGPTRATTPPGEAQAAKTKVT